MIRRPPRSTRTDTLCPYTTLFRSIDVNHWAAREMGLAFEVPASAHRVRIGPAPLAPPGIPLEEEIQRRNQRQATRRPRQHAVACTLPLHHAALDPRPAARDPRYAEAAAVGRTPRPTGVSAREH